MKVSVFTTRSIFRNMAFSVISIAMLLLASCSKSNDVSAPASAFAGTYTEDDYDFKIESTGGNTFKIQNFGGFMNVAVKAETDGTGLKIPSQSFTNPNGHTLTIVGTAVLTSNNKKDDTIKIEYSMTGFTNYSGEIIGVRK